MAHLYHELRFERTYGLPVGRKHIATKSLEHQYLIKKTIDRGGDIGGLNAGVFLVENLQNNKLGVLKRIPPSDRELEREILFLQVLKHPNIVSYRDAFITDDIPKKIGLYLEYCSGGSLADLMDKYIERNGQESHKPPAYVPEAFVWHTLHSLTHALQFIHHGIKSSDRRNPPVPMDAKHWPIILHRDIKPENVFLNHCPLPQGKLERSRLYPHWPFNEEDPQHSMTTYPRIVLADFVSSFDFYLFNWCGANQKFLISQGLATQHNEPDFPDIDKYVGTIQWMPPELPEATARGDVWTLGAVILSFCRLLRDGPLALFPRPPQYRNNEEWAMNPEARKGVRDIGPGSSYSEELKGVLKCCLRYNKHHRPLSYELLVHVREGERKVIGSPRAPITPLPPWAS